MRQDQGNHPPLRSGCDDLWLTCNLPIAIGRSWPNMMHPGAGRMACLFDRQVYGLMVKFM
jgi:hypothetical protein